VTVPVGTSFTLQNAGTEVHEMVLVRKNDGVTQTWDELLTLPEDQVTQFVTPVGSAIAAPGTTGDMPVQVTQEGDYLMICFIPQGTYSMPPTASGEPGMSSEPSMEPSMAAGSPGASMGIPHFMLGMEQEFTVTAAGTTPGPIASPAMSPGASMAPTNSMEPGASGSPGTINY